MQRNNQYSQPETTTIPRRMSARVSTCTGVACAWVHLCLLEEKRTVDREDGYDDAMGKEAAEPTSHMYNLLQYIKKMAEETSYSNEQSVSVSVFVERVYLLSLGATAFAFAVFSLPPSSTTNAAIVCFTFAFL